MRRLATAVALMLVIAALPAAAAIAADDPGLIEPAPGRRVLARDGAVRAQAVTVNPTLLGADVESVNFSLFPGTSFEVTRTYYNYFAPGDYDWAGEMPGGGTASFVVNGDVMVGSINTGSAMFTLRYHGDFGHAVYEWGDLPQLAHAVLPVSDPAAGATPATPAGESADPRAGAVVDVLVLYTPKAEAASGGAAGIKADIDLAILETTLALGRANIPGSFRLIKHTKVSYDATQFRSEVAIDHLRYTGDGYLENAEALRNQYGADLVSLWVDYFGGGDWAAGRGELYGVYTIGQQDWPEWVFTHEWGHNLGAGHERNQNTCSTGWVPGHDISGYACGYTDVGNFFTIMSYGNACDNGNWNPTLNCSKIYYYSNPNVNYGGRPTGQANADVARAFRITLPLVAAWRDPVNQNVKCNGKTATIIGTNNGETINGTGGNDVIAAKGGNDIINGNGGNDTICAGDGDDEVYGNAGHDTIFGEAGADTISAGTGNDIVKGGDGPDSILGGAGDDTINGEGRSDRISGGPDDDTIRGGAGNDTVIYRSTGNLVRVSLVNEKGVGDGTDKILEVESVIGSQFDDVLVGNSLINRLVGLGGNDRIQGGPGDDLMLGGKGNDNLFGEAGNDDLKGNGGDDVLKGNAGTDTGHGGPGNDTCFVENPTAC
jgi:Ca2+-binding RTX toxin-like protein